MFPERRKTALTRKYLRSSLNAVLVVASLGRATAQDVTVAGSGDDGMRQWHKVTLTLVGPEASEGGAPNPFLDYRANVTFTHPATGLTYVVPGYFAADGDAANTSASSGDAWRAHLSPDHAGTWNYAISFRQGSAVALSDDPDAGSPVAPYDGLTGSFDILETDKTGRDHRGKGRLRYVGRHHLQFADGEFFLKAGADSPENFLAYDDFDNTPNNGGRRKSWQPHAGDWRPGDPTWKGGRGKGIIGALNYLAGKGANAFSFLTYSHNGDDKNVFPHANPNDRTRMDCSKLDQWEIVFEHADTVGMYLHFKTQETENDQDMDGGALGTQRRLYYRELIARFSHHLALNWNLGEENSNTTDQRRQFAQYFWDHDPYRHNIVVHTFPGAKEQVYGPLLGDASRLTGASLQSGPGSVFGDTQRWRDASEDAGRPWVVANDEQGSADTGVKPDADDHDHDDIRKNVLWGNIMAGGAGVEYYFGYQFAHSDLTCNDYRSRDHLWDLSRFALEFFKANGLPFWNMTHGNGLVSSSSAWCLAGDHQYVIYLKNGGTTDLDLTGLPGVFEVKWYDPRNGGELRTGSVQAVSGGADRSLGRAPESQNNDWVILVRPADPDQNFPPGVDAGDDRSVMLPRNGNSVVVDLDGTVTDDGRPTGALTASWSKRSGPGTVTFGDASAADTAATFTGRGVYVLKLTASDGELTGSDLVAITVEPFSTRVTKRYGAVDDAYIEGSTKHDNQQLKVEPNRRISYLKFDVTGLPAGGEIIAATLKLIENGDPGNGTLRFYKGSHNNWTEGNLSPANAPATQNQVGLRSGSVAAGQTIEVDVTPLISGDGTYTVVITMDGGGNDIWFGSDESSRKPELTVTAQEEEAQADAHQMPGDCNQDGDLDISDPICLLGYLFLGDPTVLPCEGGTREDPGNGALLNFDGSVVRDGEGNPVVDPDGHPLHIVDLTDPIAMLMFLFLGGGPHVLGTECTPIAGCPDACALPAPTVAQLITAESPAGILIPGDGLLGFAWTEADFDDAGWLPGQAAVGFDEKGTYVPHFTTDVEGPMHGVNTSVYIRIGFTIAEFEAVDRLILRIKYDDGFVAYLNEVAVAERNAPATLGWNATAAAVHPDDQAVVFESVDISAAANVIGEGENVLALHGLNASLSSSDFLLAAELEAHLR